MNKKRAKNHQRVTKIPGKIPVTSWTWVVHLTIFSLEYDFLHQLWYIAGFSIRQKRAPSSVFFFNHRFTPGRSAARTRASSSLGSSRDHPIQTTSMKNEDEKVSSWKLTYPLPKVVREMVLLFQRWDMLFSWKVHENYPPLKLTVRPWK